MWECPLRLECPRSLAPPPAAVGRVALGGPRPSQGPLVQKGELVPKMDLKSSFVTRESAQALVECGARLGTCVPRTHPALRLLQTCGEHGVSSFVLLLSHGVVMSRKGEHVPLRSSPGGRAGQTRSSYQAVGGRSCHRGGWWAAGRSCRLRRARARSDRGSRQLARGGSSNRAPCGVAGDCMAPRGRARAASSGKGSRSRQTRDHGGQWRPVVQGQQASDKVNHSEDRLDYEEQPADCGFKHLPVAGPGVAAFPRAHGLHLL